MIPGWLTGESANMRLTIGKKLALGFAAVLLLMVVNSVITFYSVANMNRSVNSVVDEAFPLVSACNQLLNGLHHSVAALRGYLILGEDPKQAAFFKKDRKQAWATIDAAMAT